MVLAMYTHRFIRHHEVNGDEEKQCTSHKTKRTTNFKLKNEKGKQNKNMRY